MADRRQVTSVVLAIGMLVVFGAGVGTAAGSGHTIKACEKKSTGALRIDNHCHSSEKAVSWNSEGPRGPKGSKGDKGAKGSTGARGASGAAGARGATGATGPRGATGPQGPAGKSGSGAAGNMVLVSEPAWGEEPHTSANFTTSLSTSGAWDTLKYSGGASNSNFNDFIQTPVLSMSELGGTTMKLKSMQFCYGQWHPSVSSGFTSVDDITHVWLYAITMPDSITAATQTSPPGGSTTTTLLSSSTVLAHHGCETYTPTSQPLDSHTMLLARVEWNVYGDYDAYLYLGRTTYTFTPAS